MSAIRVALPADAAQIARIEVDTWRASYAGILPTAMLLNLDQERRTRSWRRTIATEFGDTLVAAEGEEIAGFGSCGRQRVTSLPYSSEIFTLYVTPDRQNRGIGRALLTGMFEHLIAEGHRSSIVWVLQQNPSRFFYERLGARYVATRPIPVWRGDCVDAAGYGWQDLHAALRLRGQAPSRIG